MLEEAIRNSIKYLKEYMLYLKDREAATILAMESKKYSCEIKDIKYIIATLEAAIEKQWPLFIFIFILIYVVPLTGGRKQNEDQSNDYR